MTTSMPTQNPQQVYEPWQPCGPGAPLDRPTPSHWRLTNAPAAQGILERIDMAALTATAADFAADLVFSDAASFGYRTNMPVRKRRQIFRAGNRTYRLFVEYREQQRALGGGRYFYASLEVLHEEPDQPTEWQVLLVCDDFGRSSREGAMRVALRGVVENAEEALRSERGYDSYHDELEGLIDRNSRAIVREFVQLPKIKFKTRTN
jgi:hypothetical protein